VPSWNNNHYCYLVGATPLLLPVSRETSFHPTPAQIAEVLPSIRLLALCSPLNPTGTRLEPNVLAEICRLLVAENQRRAQTQERPVFLLFDQVYWALDFEQERPPTPASLVPEVAPYVVLLDAVSKSLAATGLRVGWSFAAPAVTSRMSDLVGHVGAWAPKAEQIAVANFLDEPAHFTSFRAQMRTRLSERLELLHQGFSQMRAKGLPVDSIQPQGTLYLSAHFDWFGRTVDGLTLSTNEQIRSLLLQKAGLAVVPFQAFGLARENGWFRLSVGAASLDSIRQGLARLEELCASLSSPS
jgi:aspartate aminotransferase